MSDRVLTIPAHDCTVAKAFRVFTGKPPLTAAEKAEREAETKAFLIRRRDESRRELEELRDRLCALASPELAARFRAKWAADDAFAAQGEERRSAA